MFSLSSTKGSSPPTRLNGVVVQQSTYGVPLTIGWGTNRVQGNLVWYNGFKAQAVKQSSGKGGGSSTTGYNYSASIIMAIGDGPITGVRNVYKDQAILTPGGTTALQQAGLSLATGTQGQAVWGYLTTNYSAQAIGYSRTAYAYASNYPLSTSATLANHSFEVQWATRAVVSGSTIDDANPADIVTDFLTNAYYGVPLWKSGLLASLTAYQTYCTAAGLFLSPNMPQTRTAMDFLVEILDASNSDAVWSAGQLNIVPLGDVAITNNGVTYTPNLTPHYNFTEDDFIPPGDGEDPVKVSLAKLADAYNSVQIGFLDRSLNYNSNIAGADDLGSIVQYGARREDVHTLNSVCDKAVAAALAQLRVQRLSNLRRTFTFSVDERYCLLDCLDLVTLTSGDLNQVLVRINEIDEKPDGTLEITAEEMLVGANHAAVYTRQNSVGTQINTNVAPGHVNTPVLINPPRTLTNNDLQAWIAVSGGTNWGGCQVFTSVDGTNYQYQGQINAPARYGTLTSALANVADPDTTSTFGVDLTTSLGTLNTATAADANAASTLCLVDSELISYQTATLTAANKYNLTTLIRRGLMGTAPAAHSIGAPFVRLDGGIFKFSFTSQQDGKTIHVKFCSFNTYGQALEDISTVTDYTLTLSAGSSSFAWSNLSGVPTVITNYVTSGGTAVDTANVGGVPSGTLNSNVNNNTANILQTALVGAAYQSYQNALNMLGGQALATVLQTFQSSQTSLNATYANNFTFLGATNAGNTAWVLNGSSVFVNSTTSLASYLTYVSNVLGDGSTSIASISASVSGQTSRISLTTNSSGQIVGLNMGTSGTPTSGYFDIIAPNFRLIDPSASTPLIPISYSSGAWTLNSNVTVNGSLIVTGTITTTSIAANNVTNTLASTASSTVSGTGSLVAAFTHNVTMAYAGTITAYAQIKFGDGGGHSATDHSSDLQVQIDGTVVGRYQLTGNPNAVASDFVALGSATVSAGSHTVTMQVLTQSFDNYTFRTLVTQWFYR